MDPETQVTIFVAFVLGISLSIWGRRLREEAFRQLSADQKGRVMDKIPNYTSTEMVPFGGLVLGLVAILLFKLAWLTVAYPIFLSLVVLLVAVFHVRTRRRFRSFDLPPAFLARYERSRIVTYGALVAPLATLAWMVYR